MFTFEQIKEFVELVARHRLHGLEIERSGFHLRITGEAATVAREAAPAAVVAAAPSSPSAAQAAVHAAPAGPAREAAPAPPVEALHVVTSPIVGHLLHRAQPRRRRRSSKVGDRVRKGQVLCIVEAMKLMNEIECDVDGDDRRDLPEERAAGRVRRAALRGSARADARIRPPMFTQDPDRQPRRDRAARHPRLPRARHPDRGRLLDGRPRLPARHLADEDGLHRTAALGAELPQHLEHHLRGRDHRRRRDPPRLRLPLRERALRRGAAASAISPSSGPPPEAIRRMGDKAVARQTAAAAGVPVLPGSADPLASARGGDRDRRARSATR